MKKTLCMLLMVAMLLTMVPLTVFAADATPAGTPIYTAEQLKAMSASGTYYLASDITISGNWDYATPFAGTLDGNGHTIYFADGTVLAGGLFRELKNCTIKNLNIVQLGVATYNIANSQTLGNPIEGTGVLAALAYGDDKGDKASTITDVTIYANVNVSHGKNVGGFIGEVRYSALLMERCSFDGSIKSTGGSNDYGAAGMVGGTWQRSYNFTIKDCVNYATITAESFAAGILAVNRIGGYNNDNCLRNTRIQYCMNYGDITSTNSEYAGGIFAVYRKNDATVEVRFRNNINYGAITASASNGKAGGVGGGFRSNNDNGAAQLMGNINYGVITGSWTTNTVANPYNGSIATRQYNYCSTAYSGGYGADVITDAAAVVNTLNGAGFDGSRPQIYAVLPNGKITLTWAAEAFEEGNGTAIMTARELAAMSASGTYYLAKDITITGNWDYAAPFAGTLDGNGHTIYFADGTVLAGGLFRELKNCTIKNLNIKQLGAATYNTATSQTLGNTIEGTGVLAALAYGDDKGDKKSTIQNVSIYANITASHGKHVGGFIGEVRYSALLMERCVFDGSITSTGGSDNYGTAGMVGGSWQRSYEFTIQECVNYANITAEGFAAGIFGTNRVGGYNNDNCFRNTRIQYCVNYGDIKTTKSEYAGGIFARYLENDTKVQTRFRNNINYGTIENANTTSGKNLCAGGIGGGFRGSNNGETTSQLMGNINYGTVKGSWVSNMVVNPWTGSIKTRQYNYCGTAVSGGYGSDVITDAAALVSSLNAAGFDGNKPRIYTLLPNGKITLTWAKELGYANTTPTAIDATLLGTQLSGDGTDATRSVRFVGGLSSYENLDNVGVLIIATFGDGSQRKVFEGKTDVVYTTILADGEEAYAAEYGKSYFYTAVVNNIPTSLGTVTFEVRTFQLVDGVVVYNNPTTVNVDLTQA